MTGMLFREIGSPSAKGTQLNKSTAMLEGVRYIQLRVTTRFLSFFFSFFIIKLYDLTSYPLRSSRPHTHTAGHQAGAGPGARVCSAVL